MWAKRDTPHAARDCEKYPQLSRVFCLWAGEATVIKCAISACVSVSSSLLHSGSHCFLTAYRSRSSLGSLSIIRSLLESKKVCFIRGFLSHRYPYFYVAHVQLFSYNLRQMSRVPYLDLQHSPVDLRGCDVSLLPEPQSLIAGVPGLHTRTSMEDKSKMCKQFDFQIRLHWNWS